MPTRQDLIDNTIADFRDKLNRNYDYNTELAQVINGAPNPNIVNQFPTLCIYLIRDTILDEDLGGERERQALFLVIGYTNNVDDIHKFSEDVEKFLYSSDFTYYNETMLEDEGVTFSTDGVSGEVGLASFDLNFIINYTQEF